MRSVTIDAKIRRKRRISSSIKGTKDRPRISIFRSNNYTYCQAIDDVGSKTIAAFSSLNLKKNGEKVKKTESANLIGKELGNMLKKKKITRAVFDRGLYSYKGRVKAVCEGLREVGIKI